MVALMEDPSPSRVTSSLRQGASAVVDWDAQPEHIVTVLDQALTGLAMLPIGVVHWMARETTPSNLAPLISVEELEWIRLLSSGCSVIKLSQQFGYSERAMFRHLSRLYARLGASNRAEAIVAAARFGFLE